MTDWSGLQHAYGTAEDVPELQARTVLPGSDGLRAWRDLWGCLCHQGTVYSASYAAIPELAAMAADIPPERRPDLSSRFLNPLYLAAAILGSSDIPVDARLARIRRRHASGLATLEDLAVAGLALPDLHEDPDGFLHLLQAILIFRDVAVSPCQLGDLYSGGHSIDCPGCRQPLHAVIQDDDGFVVALADSDDLTAIQTLTPRTPVVPAAPEELDEVASWLHSTAAGHAQTALAQRLRRLFGRARCPACELDFTLTDAIRAAHLAGRLAGHSAHLDDPAPPPPLWRPGRVCIQTSRFPEHNTDMLIIAEHDESDWLGISRPLVLDATAIELGMDYPTLWRRGEAWFEDGVDNWHLDGSRLRLHLLPAAAHALGLGPALDLRLEPEDETLAREHLPRLLA